MSTIENQSSTPSAPSGIEAIVCADIARRQALGIKKYGQTVADNPLPLLAWLQHGYEEALDLAVYLRRTMAEIDGQAAPMAPTAGRAEASQALSRLLDAQVEEIKKLRERVADFAARLHEAEERHERDYAAHHELSAKHMALVMKDREIEALLAYIDTRVPPADSTCEEPGISFTEACRRDLREITEKGGA